MPQYAAYPQTIMGVHYDQFDELPDFTPVGEAWARRRGGAVDEQGLVAAEDCTIGGVQYEAGADLSGLDPALIRRSLKTGCAGSGEAAPPNTPPVSNAGTDQNVSTNALVTLNGSASSDPDEDSLSYSWTQTGGTAVTLSSATVASPTFTAPATASVLTFSLEVDDGEDTHTDSVTVTVTVPNTPPVSNAGPDQSVDTGQVVTLNGSASSDPDMDSLTYLWSQTSGTAVTLSSTTVASPTFTAPGSAATLVFQLEVDDGEDTHTDTVTITVTAPPPPFDTSILAFSPSVYLHLDESSGVAVDNAGTSTDLTCSAAPTWGGPPSGGLGGTSASGWTTGTACRPASTLNIGGISTGYTLFGAFRTTGSADADIISSHRGGTQYVFGVDAAGHLILTHYASAGTPVITSSGTYRDDAWHLAFATWDGSNIRLYIDGALVAGPVAAASILANSGPSPYVGVSRVGSSSYTRPWLGYLDEVGIIPNVALSLAQIQALHASWLG